jgi:D-alanine-D-alanine ligase-like ATP-grasp enzyme
MRLDIPRERVNFKIRSYENGWVFCRENIQKPDDLEAVSIAAVSAIGLTFGAVDVIYNEKQNKCFVLEVNTAPGLTGTTINSYATAIMELM